MPFTGYGRCSTPTNYSKQWWGSMDGCGPSRIKFIPSICMHPLVTVLATTSNRPGHGGNDLPHRLDAEVGFSFGHPEEQQDRAGQRWPYVDSMCVCERGTVRMCVCVRERARACIYEKTDLPIELALNTCTRTRSWGWENFGSFSLLLHVPDRNVGQFLSVARLTAATAAIWRFESKSCKSDCDFHQSQSMQQNQIQL